MASWGEILEEVQSHGKEVSSLDIVLQKYVSKFSEFRKRNTICYYADFENKSRISNAIINSSDIHGFMCALKGLDKGKGLDLILHTHGILG